MNDCRYRERIDGDSEYDCAVCIEQCGNEGSQRFLPSQKESGTAWRINVG